MGTKVKNVKFLGFKIKIKVLRIYVLGNFLRGIIYLKKLNFWLIAVFMADLVSLGFVADKVIYIMRNGGESYVNFSTHRFFFSKAFHRLIIVCVWI